jgi:hypothetical protein
MTRRRSALLIVTITGLGLVLLAFFGTKDKNAGVNVAPRQFTRSQFDRIAKGMTREQVAEVLGASPGDYSVGKVDYFVMENGQMADAFSPRAEHKDAQHWWSLDGGIFVDFNEHNRAVRAVFFPVRSRSP